MSPHSFTSYLVKQEISKSFVQKLIIDVLRGTAGKMNVKELVGTARERFLLSDQIFSGEMTRLVEAGELNVLNEQVSLIIPKPSDAAIAQAKQDHINNILMKLKSYKPENPSRSKISEDSPFRDALLSSLGRFDPSYDIRAEEIVLFEK